MVQFNFEAIGTTWQIDIYSPLNPLKESEVFDSIQNRIGDFDKTYSRFREDSVVTKMSREVGIYDLPEDSKKLFSIYFDLYKKTDGYFTPLVGNLLSDAGYDAKYSLEQKKELEKPQNWEDVIDFRYPKLIIKKPVILDFGAGGKGYLIDLVAEVLEQNNIFEYCIDAGGDILQKNNESIRIGLENPDNTDQVIGVCELKNRSICGSAGTRRKWGDFTHIMNPKTLESPKDIIAVWTVAKSTLLADCMATCLFFVSPERLLLDYDFDYAILKEDFSIISSKKFPGEFFVD